MTLENISFMERFHAPELRAELPEDLSKVPFIPLDRLNGDVRDVWSIDGYYQVKNSVKPIREIREYRGKSAKDVMEQAKENGLVGPIMVEAYLGAPQPCILGLSRGEYAEVMAEHQIWLTKRTTDRA